MSWTAMPLDLLRVKVAFATNNCMIELRDSNSNMCKIVAWILYMGSKPVSIQGIDSFSIYRDKVLHLENIHSISASNNQ
jgi:hypothetical protein